MSSPVRFSSPFIKKFIHSTVSVQEQSGLLLPAAQSHERRAAVIVQNQSTTASLWIALNSESGLDGIYIAPLGSISFDNYNGPIRAWGSAVLNVHLAYATA